MGISVKQGIGLIQRWCDYADYLSSPDSRVAEFMVREIDAINADLGLTERPWNLSTFPITVTAGEDHHPITEVGDFGTLAYVETQNLSNLFHVVRVITPEDPIDNVRFNLAGTLGPTGIMHAALGVDVTEMPGQPGVRALRFAPKPNAQANYTVGYVPEVVRPQSIQDSITKYPRWEELILVGATLANLPYCRWEGLTPPETNETKRATLRGDVNTPGTLSYMYEKVLMPQFIRGRRRINQHHINRVRPFGRHFAGRR